MSDVKWIKIVTDIFDDEKIILIEAMPESDAMIVIWFKILCLAGKQNNGGVLMLNDRMPYTDEMLSTIFRRSISTVRLALGTFQQLDMIEIVSGAVTIPNWEKHQSLDKLERVREQTRERVAEHRNKQKLLADCNANSNVTVTHGNDTDKIRVDKKREDKSRVDTERSDFDVAIDFFKEHRKKLKKPMTDHAVDLLKKDLEKLAPGNVEKQIELLNYAIKKTWLGVYPMDDKPEPKKQEVNNADRYAITEGFKTSF